MKVLNLYAGIGGNRAFWDAAVTAVEYQEDIAAEYQRRFPDDTVVVGDAHAYLLENYENFDFIWASPPCPTHSRMWGQNRTPGYPCMNLYQEILFLQRWAPGSWVVENVKPWYKPMIEPSGVCGRHLFWSDIELFWLPEPPPRPDGFMKGATTEDLADYLGLPPARIYCGKGHDPNQAMRNCVHPTTGQAIFEAVKKVAISRKENFSAFQND